MNSVEEGLRRDMMRSGAWNRILTQAEYDFLCSDAPADLYADLGGYSFEDLRNEGWDGTGTVTIVNETIRDGPSPEALYFDPNEKWQKPRAIAGEER